MDQGDLVTRLRALADEATAGHPMLIAAIREAADALEKYQKDLKATENARDQYTDWHSEARAEIRDLKAKLAEQKERIMRKEFQVHVLNETAIDKANQMAVRFSELADWLDTVCEKSPELTIADRKLEEACFYAKRAMAQQRENQA